VLVARQLGAERSVCTGGCSLAQTSKGTAALATPGTSAAMFATPNPDCNCAGGPAVSKTTNESSFGPACHSHSSLGGHTWALGVWCCRPTPSACPSRTAGCQCPHRRWRCHQQTPGGMMVLGSTAVDIEDSHSQPAWGVWHKCVCVRPNQVRSACSSSLNGCKPCCIPCCCLPPAYCSRGGQYLAA
jgi:hypothetical protein